MPVASPIRVRPAHPQPYTRCLARPAHPLERPSCSAPKPPPTPFPLGLSLGLSLSLSSALLGRLQSLAQDRGDSPEKLAAMLVEAGLDYLEGYPGESPNSSNINPVDNDFDDSEIIPWP